jgi:hypothetical protein
MDSSILTVPQEVIPRLREGVRLQLAHGAEAVHREVAAWPKGEPPLAGRALMDSAWSVIDLIGWTGDVPGSIELDLAENGAVLLAAVEQIVPLVEGWLDELDPVDPRREQRADELRLLLQFQVQVRGVVGAA